MVVVDHSQACPIRTVGMNLGTRPAFVVVTARTSGVKGRRLFSQNRNPTSTVFSSSPNTRLPQRTQVYLGKPMKLIERSQNTVANNFSARSRNDQIKSADPGILPGPPVKVRHHRLSLQLWRAWHSQPWHFSSEVALLLSERSELQQPDLSETHRQSHSHIGPSILHSVFPPSTPTPTQRSVVPMSTVSRAHQIQYT